MHKTKLFSDVICQLKTVGCDFLGNEYNLIDLKTQEVLGIPLTCCSYNQIKSPRKTINTDFSRGFIFDNQSKQFLAVPFVRSYNIEEYPDAINKYLNKPVKLELCAKEDGSLLKVYKFKNTWIIASNSTCIANFAGIHHTLEDKANNLSLSELFLQTIYPQKTFKEADILFQTKMNEMELFYLENHFKDFSDLTALTFNFELCTPANKVVVDYTPTTYFLATTAIAVENNSNIYLRLVNKNQTFDLFKQPTYLEFEYQFSNLDQLLSKIKENLPPYFHEGFIVYLDGQAFKYKTESYVAKHHLKGNGIFTIDRAISIFMANEHHEFLSSFPEHKHLFDKLEKIYFDAELELNNFITNHLPTYLKDMEFLSEKVIKKQFASQYSSHPYFHLFLYVAFKVKDGSVMCWLKTSTPKTVEKFFTKSL